MTRFDDRFVRSLPADPETDNVVRQVRGAAYSKVQPTPVSKPTMLAWVPEVAALLGLPEAPTDEWTTVLAGNALLPGMAPYAACYGGHQFGNWAGQLGDGRAITLGEVIAPDDSRWDLQLKGPGPTPYSRRADGRAVLRSSLRELVCSEAMFHLGVPTTRALALVATGDQVERDLLYDGNARFEPGAITTRVAPSFIRFGTFELPASRGDKELLQKLVDFTVTTFFPSLGAPSPETYVAFFSEVVRRTAVLMMEWQRVGFVHGVMNTDNLSILGLTIDYGPYGWLEGFDPGWTPNTTDLPGKRYAFGNQPQVAQWNLMCLANALFPLVGEAKPLEDALEGYADIAAAEQLSMMRKKLGLAGDDVKDRELMRDLFRALMSTETDMTLFYRLLARVPAASVSAPDDALVAPLAEAFYAPEQVKGDVLEGFAEWLRRYLQRAGPDDGSRAKVMNASNPLYVPRNYLAQTVIQAVEQGEPSMLAEWLTVLKRPYVEQPGMERWAKKRPEWARHQPGSSMLSCSS
ncbi:MAG: YdiU family protein [Archangiaceae bacterium]|nr:YdiU family protein [Archangiaceae bacterium]